MGLDIGGAVERALSMLPKESKVYSMEVEKFPEEIIEEQKAQITQLEKKINEQKNIILNCAADAEANYKRIARLYRQVEWLAQQCHKYSSFYNRQMNINEPENTNPHHWIIAARKATHDGKEKQ